MCMAVTCTLMSFICRVEEKNLVFTFPFDQIWSKKSAKWTYTFVYLSSCELLLLLLLREVFKCQSEIGYILYPVYSGARGRNSNPSQ